MLAASNINEKVAFSVHLCNSGHVAPDFIAQWLAEIQNFYKGIAPSFLSSFYVL
jgi:hypothetical protein